MTPELQPPWELKRSVLPGAASAVSSSPPSDSVARHVVQDAETDREIATTTKALLGQADSGGGGIARLKRIPCLPRIRDWI